ncbi:hypothetical protein KJR05_01815 [Streptococcus parasanguinis]|nr:hypothetical protein [Streptococcus parasanguinis]
MTFKVVNKYAQDANRTFVAIRQDAPYTAFDRVLIGDRTNDTDEALIEAVLGQIATEFNPADGVKKLQEDLHTQAQEYEAKLAKKDEGIQKVKDVAEWSVLARVTDVDNPLDPTVFKRGLELVDLGKVGETYPAQAIFALEDPNHVEKFSEGKRVMVQVTEPFTYNGETLDQLESLHQNGKIGIWKWTEPKPEDPKPAGELETQPVQ